MKTVLVYKHFASQKFSSLRFTKFILQSYSANRKTNLSIKERPRCYLPQIRRFYTYTGLITDTVHPSFRKIIIISFIIYYSLSKVICDKATKPLECLIVRFRTSTQTGLLVLPRIAWVTTLKPNSAYSVLQRLLLLRHHEDD